jgi:NADH:ubiquinone oxidoreductase subunit
MMINDFHRRAWVVYSGRHEETKVPALKYWAFVMNSESDGVPFVIE